MTVAISGYGSCVKMVTSATHISLLGTTPELHPVYARSSKRYPFTAGLLDLACKKAEPSVEFKLLVTGWDRVVTPMAIEVLWVLLIDHPDKA